jgi:Lrp/AsnC family transcriptional regulator, regulator of ectoine-degradation genes
VITPNTLKTKIDRLDMRILAAVAARGRQTVTELSKSVGLSLSPCTTRLERLEADQLITGYHAEIDVERLADLSLYYVTVALTPYDTETARKIEEIIIASPYIVSADALFGANDYLLCVYARSTQHYYEIVAPFTALHADCETWPVSRRIVRPQIDRLIAQLKRENVKP